MSGLLPRTGQVRFAGQDISTASPRETVRAGLVHVVEGHRVFTQLSVFDNLLLAGYGLSRDVRATQVEEALTFFPEIAAKRNDRAVTLSGGQQQMLAVAQGLVARPRLLMLDEPSAGLSPVLVDRVLAAVVRLARGGHCRAAGRAADREGGRRGRSRLCPGAGLDRPRSARERGPISRTGLEHAYFGADAERAASPALERWVHASKSPPATA
jgi:branched-chain amino acid transport system ATP-binding protein